MANVTPRMIRHGTHAGSHGTRPLPHALSLHPFGQVQRFPASVFGSHEKWTLRPGQLSIDSPQAAHG